MQYCRTSMQAVRKIQAEIICRSRRKVKPSSEVLQTVPDLFEIFSETQPHRTGQRRLRKLHLNLWNKSQLSQRPLIAAGYSTSIQILPEAVKSELCANVDSAEEVSLLNVVDGCRELKLHPDGAVSSDRHPLNSRLSLEDVLAHLQNSRDIISNQVLDRVQGLVEEIQRRRLCGQLVPEKTNLLDLDYLLGLTSQTGRKKFLNFLARKEKLKRKQAEKRALKRDLKVAKAGTSELTLGNTFIRCGQSAAVSAANTWTIARSMIFGPPIVFDLSYDAHMDRGEVVNTIMQLSIVLKINKTMQDPFHIHFTNVAEHGRTDQELRRVYGAHLDDLMISVTDKCPEHVFDAEQLVYLTADSPNVLTGFDPQKIYIVGGFVDRKVRSRISLSKAEAAGLSHARLPLDEHLRWHKSTKNLTLDQMMSILMEMRSSGDWTRALQHVPQRKHLGTKTQS